VLLLIALVDLMAEQAGKQIGKAVPVRLAQALTREMIREYSQ
jgi:hypothetical protein